jgi:4'-phosphopantetheinyl transferase
VSVRAARVKSINSGSDLEIVFVDLEASATLLDAQERDAPRLSPAEIAHLDKLAAERQRQRLWRLSRIATRVVLERGAGVSLRKVDFVIASGGRPSLPEEPPFFNISHSGQAVLIAVSNSGPVGVDLEQERRLAMSDDRRRRVVAAAAKFSSGPPLSAGCDADVMKAWVRLEALSKGLGTGIGRLLTEEGVIGGATAASDATAATRLDVSDLEVARGYFAAVAAGTLPRRIEVVTFPRDADGIAGFLSRNRT